MSANKKRQLQSYLDEQTARYDELQRMSYADRLRVLKQDWTEMFFVRDAHPDKQARVELETSQDPSIQNAIFRVNTASQKPNTEQIDSFIRDEKTRSRDRFMQLVSTIDDLNAKLKEIEPQALAAFASAQQLQYFTDLRLGTYDARKDAELIRQHCEADPEAKPETQTKPAEANTENKTDREAKPETEAPAESTPESKSETQTPAENKPVETKTEVKPETQTQTPAETKTEVKPETQTQTPAETKPDAAPAETKTETQTPTEAPAESKLQTTVEPNAQTTPEIKSEAGPGAAVSVNA